MAQSVRPDIDQSMGSKDENDGGEFSDECDETAILFHKAADLVGQHSSSFTQAQLLYLYARYKQVTVGPCNLPRPGMFDFKGKQKWDAWNSIKDMSVEVAKQEYISTVESVLPGTDLSRQTGSRSGMGVSVSTLRDRECTEAMKEEHEKTVFDLVTENNLERVKDLLVRGDVDINAKDDMGMALVHWAADRGLADMMELLLDHGAEVDVRDADQQTPLHYACSCEYVDVVETLMLHGSDPELRCDDGMLPSDHTKDPDILVKLGR